MRNIIKIFKHDLKNAARNLIVFIVIIGLSILPALYAWFNIAANWDPYSSTGDIPFAVCSEDKGYTYKALGINAGDEIVSNLKQNNKMGWTFVEKEEALKGVEDGTYYAAIIIPEDFSECLCSITTGKFKQAEIQYYVNEKKNAIAPKMTNAGVNTVKEQINSTYVNTITTVIATTLNLTTDELASNKISAADSLIETLDELNTEIDTFNSSIDVFSSAIVNIDEIIKTSKESLPNIQKALNQSESMTFDVKSAITSARNASKQISSSIEQIIDSTQASADNVNTQITNAFNNIENDSAGAAEELLSVTKVNSKIISVNNRVIEILQNLQNNFGIDASYLINQLNNSNNHQQELINKLSDAASTLMQIGTLPNESLYQIKNLAQSCSSEITSIQSSFQPIKSSLDVSVDNVYKVLDDASGILQTLSGDIPELEKDLDSASKSLKQTQKTFDSLKTFLNHSKKKVENLISKVEEVRDNNTIENFISTIIENPNALGEFVSNPVTTVTNSVYPLDNYGSGMSPFYTSLGFWVGGTILVAVVKTDLTKKELRELDRPNSTELFFGRYLIFFFIGQIQAWIIALGDMFFLKVQVNDPVLFICGSLAGSFVYTLIIYSMTITFSVVGKALAVVILVIQIAGSGGTFPIEVLPAPFKAISPYLPFKYGINLLREAVAGASMDAYFYNLAMLLAFVPVSLILGLLLRRPCIKLISFFDNRVEQSDIII